MAEHSTLTGSSLHEPKGVAAASVDKIYIADGAGSGSWVYAPGIVFSEIAIKAGSVVHAIAAASAYTLLNPAAQWVTGFTNINTNAPSSGTLVLTQAGVYKIDYWLDFDSAALAANTRYYFKYAIDGVPSDRRVIVKKATTAIENIFVAFSGFIQVTAGQTVSLFVAGDGTSSSTNMTPREAGLSATLVKAL